MAGKNAASNHPIKNRYAASSAYELTRNCSNVKTPHMMSHIGIRYWIGT